MNRTVNLFIGLLSWYAAASFADANAETDNKGVTEFHIPAGTGHGAWNTEETMVIVKLGDTVRIINDDHIVHALHTSGAPCPHSPPIAPAGSYDCIATKLYDSQASGPLYDHYSGPENSAFWIKAILQN
jgi:hypothetical protein